MTQHDLPLVSEATPGTEPITITVESRVLAIYRVLAKQERRRYGALMREAFAFDIARRIDSGAEPQRKLVFPPALCPPIGWRP